VAQTAEPTTLERSASVKLRRGLALLFMTLVVPGSAQLAAGNKQLGRFALRTWGIALALLLVVGALALWARNLLIGLMANGVALTIAGILLIALCVGWAVLFVDAWRIARPSEMTAKPRVALTVVTGVLCLGLVGLSVGAANYLRTAGSFIDTVFTGGGDTQVKDGRFNILLIGGDAGPNREGMRADSINVASIDARTGRTVLFGLPRNLEAVPFPASSPLHELYPDGFWCESHECMLNAIYMLGEEHKDLYPGVKYPGIAATTEAVEETLGLDINYFAMIDMHGFEQLIDAVGGITISTKLKVPIGGGTSPIFGYIGPGENLHLDGYHALWFARSREGSSDYERMTRQKCVMNAMLHQLDPWTVFEKFSAIADAGKGVIDTDVPSSEIGTLLDLAAKGKDKVKSVSFTPPLIATGNPNFELIRSTVSRAIGESEELDKRATEPAQSQEPTTSQSTAKPSSKPSASKPSSSASPTGATQSLDDICKVV
jgi:LCP family protein required for cell wall assembly